MISSEELGILGIQTFAGKDYDEYPDDEERFPAPQWKWSYTTEKYNDGTDIINNIYSVTFIMNHIVY